MNEVIELEGEEEEEEFDEATMANDDDDDDDDVEELDLEDDWGMINQNYLGAYLLV